MDTFTHFHPHYTYTFESINESPFEASKNKSTIYNLFNQREMLAPNIMKLYKQDIKTNYFGCKKYLRIDPTVTNHQTGFVVFSFHDMPDSQDTKTIFSTFVILGTQGIDNCDAILKTCKAPYLMFLKKDGTLTEYTGPINSGKLKQYLQFAYPFC